MGSSLRQGFYGVDLGWTGNKKGPVTGVEGVGGVMWT